MTFLRSRTVRVQPGVKPVGSRQGPVRILTATGFSLGWAGTVLQALLGVLLERFGGAAKVHTKGKTSVEQAGPGKGFPPIFSRWGAYPYRHWFFLGVGRRRMPRLSGGL